MKGKEDHVYLLKKALYGLKQAPRNNRIDEYLMQLGFKKRLNKATLYIKGDKINIIIVSLYVDDLLITGSNEGLVKKFSEDMKQTFEMTDLGEMTYFLGIETKQKKGEVFISQQKYAKEILKKFKMDECKSVDTSMSQNEKLMKEVEVEKIDEKIYRSLVGCLMYLTSTRPDILHSVSLLSRFTNCATETHLKAAKRVLRYVRGTLDDGINFRVDQDCILYVYSDSDWGGSLDDMKSTTGYCSTLGPIVFSWCCKKQNTVAQSTAEAEFIAAGAAVNESL